MKGLELAKAYFEEYGRPMLEEKFKDKLDKIAVGLVGHGSECFGYDDEISTDHDFEPGFCIWVTKEGEDDFGFKLFRAYNSLPKEYKGFKMKETSLFGSDTKGVHTIEDFYSFYIGHIPTTNEEWLRIPDFYLAEATNGEIFFDNLGEFTRIRNILKNNRPNDVRLKKLASSIFYMAQEGQYNYQRCLKHNEKVAAANCLANFAENTAKAVYLLNNKYAPYYKWLFRGMRELEILGSLYNDLELLLDDPYNKNGNNNTIIDNICKQIEDEIRKEELSDRTEIYLEGYAYCINNKIKDNNLRNSPIML